MKREKFIALFSKKHAGEITDEDSKLLNTIIQDNEEYRILSTELTSYFEEKEKLQPNTDQLNHIWEKIDRSEQKVTLGDSFVLKNELYIDGKFDYSTPKKSLFHDLIWLKVAAILVVCIGTGVLGYQLIKNNADQDFDTLTTANEKTIRILDDGTKIWLNKNSSISYNKDFGKHKREITLAGEAYFDVVKNKNVPLFIHVGNMDIEVKGTAFNVNAYNGNKEIQVALVRGLIQVTDRFNHKRNVLLHPNEKLIFNSSKNNGQRVFLANPINPEALLSETRWIADTLTFNKEKLCDLALRMEKKYDLKIEIHTEKLKEKRFSGTFTNETIQQALEALKLSYPLTYTINNRLVIIKGQE